MAKRTTLNTAARARQRIAAIRRALADFEILCSGTLQTRYTTCGKPNCRCHQDPADRHGPYYDWGRMRSGKLSHRWVTAEQAEQLKQAIANHRQLKQLLRDWEIQTERLIDAQYPRQP
jgi:hypothetical protein